MHDPKTLSAEGWSEIEDHGFIDLVGPFFHRKVDDAHQYAVVAQTKPAISAEWCRVAC